jgi:phosphatidylglycerophosphate synthase
VAGAAREPRGGAAVLSIYALKPRFQVLLRPVAARLAANRITANQVTLAALIGSIAVGGVVAWRVDDRAMFLLLPAWLAIRMALNALDGMLAREFGQKSRLGFYLNEIGDIVSDAVLYAPFALVWPFDPIAVMLVIVLAVAAELVGMLGAAGGGARRYDGPMGKSDRALAFGALALWIGLGGPLPAWAAWIMAAVALLLVFTIANRVRAEMPGSRASDTALDAVMIGVVTLFARLLTGARVNWRGGIPDTRPRIYFANHNSHGDFVLVWSALPPQLRRLARPVAGADYWRKSALRRFFAARVFNSVLIERKPTAHGTNPIDQMAAALDAGASLIVFPEGSRNVSEEPLLPFKSGLYHLARARPEIELVPVWIENLNRVMPKGEFVPVPLLCTVTFGPACRLDVAETKPAFLARSRAALLACAPVPRR